MVVLVRLAEEGLRSGQAHGIWSRRLVGVMVVEEEELKMRRQEAAAGVRPCLTARGAGRRHRRLLCRPEQGRRRRAKLEKVTWAAARRSSRPEARIDLMGANRISNLVVSGVLVDRLTPHSRPLVAVRVVVTLGAPSPPPAVGVQHGLPLLHLPYALVAPHVLVHVGRARRVVDLVPVRLLALVVPLLLQLLLLGLAPAPLPLLCGRGAIHVLVLLGRGPVGESAALGGRPPLGGRRRRGRVPGVIAVGWF